MKWNRTPPPTRALSPANISCRETLGLTPGCKDRFTSGGFAVRQVYDPGCPEIPRSSNKACSMKGCVMTHTLGIFRNQSDLQKCGSVWNGVFYTLMNGAPWWKKDEDIMEWVLSLPFILSNHWVSFYTVHECTNRFKYFHGAAMLLYFVLQCFTCLKPLSRDRDWGLVIGQILSVYLCSWKGTCDSLRWKDDWKW